MTPARGDVVPGQRRRGRPPKGTRENTRQDLLDAALKLFARQGYAATTVRQIGDEVGVRDSAIYAHFNAKQELLDALIDDAGPQLIDRLGFDFARMGDQSPSEALPELVKRLVGEWDKPRNRELTSLLTREGLLGASEAIGYVEDRMQAAFRQWSSDQGDLRFDISREVLLWEFTTPLTAIRVLHLNAQATPAERRRGKRAAEEHVDFFLKAATNR